MQGEKSMSRIGIMGGTFNPIHTGHLLLAEHALETAELDEVWMIPTGCSYLKRKEGIDILPAKDRYQMVCLAIADNDKFRCLDIEIQRPGNSYSYETMEQLKREYPGNRFFFICGADCLYTMEHWKCPDRLFAVCEILAAVRGDADREGMQEKIAELESRFGAQIRLLPFRRIEISSSEIRQRRKEGLSVQYLVPDAVRKYMEEKGLYLDE